MILIHNKMAFTAGCWKIKVATTISRMSNHKYERDSHNPCPTKQKPPQLILKYSYIQWLLLKSLV
jgi:hypothetical protein